MGFLNLYVWSLSFKSGINIWIGLSESMWGHFHACLSIEPIADLVGIIRILFHMMPKN